MRPCTALRSGGRSLDAVVDFLYLTTLVASSPCGVLAAAFEHNFLHGRSVAYAGALAVTSSGQWFLLWRIGIFSLRRW